MVFLQKAIIYKTLKQVFGFDTFRHSQQEIITHVLAGKPCLVLMPTGMGKSLCYQLPAIIAPGTTLVISPLISLMKDQVDQLKNLGINAQFINSSLSREQRESRYQKLSQDKYKIVFVAPERFAKPEFLQAINKVQIEILAIDEAHCISQWGHDFRPYYKQISQFRQKLNNPTIIALTATATPQVQQDIIKQMGFDLPEVTIFNEGVCRKNLYLQVNKPIDEAEKFSSIYKIITETPGAKIIYFSLIKNIDAFAHYLDIKKLKYKTYHGKLNPIIRKKTQQNFMQGQEELILATNAFGMGIDKADIRLVIHADMPDSLESYYQEIGRAGRDGLAAQCILYYLESDLGVQLDFLHWKNPDYHFIKKTFSLLRKNKEHLATLSYEDIQEKLVYKNRGDQRLQTVLNLLQYCSVIEGSPEWQNLQLLTEILPTELNANYINQKMERDKKRLLQLFEYIRSESCRRDLIHTYFHAPEVNCGNCDICLSSK